MKIIDTYLLILLLDDLKESSPELAIELRIDRQNCKNVQSNQD